MHLRSTTRAASGPPPWRWWDSTAPSPRRSGKFRCSASRRRANPPDAGEPVAELVFFSGTMDCGKSTLALQMDYNHRARGRGGVRFSCNDRAGGYRISSRLGLETDAVEVVDTTDFWDEVVRRRTQG